MEYLSKSALINEETTIIIEASLNTNLDYLDSLGFTVEKVKNYKTNKHLFVYKGDC